jgi:hypothetical protein
MVGQEPIRGLTIGPIENTRHPNRGYGSKACEQAMYEAKQMGATWVSLTPFGRVINLKPTGISTVFEAPFEENQANLGRAIDQAHQFGLKVMLVPHLWVESGEWRALIDPGDDAAWRTYAESYQYFVEQWARVSEKHHVDLFSVGVEQRTWVTGKHAPLYQAMIHEVRKVYHGPITYSANWDDVETTHILGELDVIGINAFYPLAEKEGASLAQLLQGGEKIAAKVRELSETWKKPVLFTEIGYTTRKDPAVRPWEWPDSMKNVTVDQYAQAQAYLALLAPMLEEPNFFGFFVWRLYADPSDTSQEAEWGFSPRAKLAELIIRDAFHTHWAADPWLPEEGSWLSARHKHPGLYPGPIHPAWWSTVP